MMCDLQSCSSARSFQLRIIRAKNIHPEPKGKFFVRFHLPAGTTSRIQLDTSEISSKEEVLVWDQAFSLQCDGSEDSIGNMIRAGRIEFELRWRSSNPLHAKFSGSRLVGRAEIPLEDVSRSQDGRIEKWVQVKLIPRSDRKSRGRVCEGANPPALLVAIQVAMVATFVKNDCRKKMKKRDDHGCGCCCYSCADSELMALEAF
ncbi:hypothetical protein Dimus_017915 [Dionaea muscipula]